jgi:hypothetical protein
VLVEVVEDDEEDVVPPVLDELEDVVPEELDELDPAVNASYVIAIGRKELLIELLTSSPILKMLLYVK